LTGDGRAQPAQVLFIAGWGRSGSTLLDRMLGRLDGVVAVGELRDVWQRGVVEDRLCGCGERFSACPFWREVGQRAFGGWPSLDVHRVTRLRSTLDRPWMLPVLLAPALWPPAQGPLNEYAELLQRLYGAIGKISGARTIVDSSKIATYALLLRHAGIRLRVLHLVRDSRGVIFSWQKHVARSDAVSRPDNMLRYGVLTGSVRYVFYNGLVHLLGAIGLPYRRVRYEDMVDDPLSGLRDAAAHAHARVDPAHVGELRGHETKLGIDHTVDGNTMRFQLGTVTLRRDEAWKVQLPRGARAAVTAVTLPLLARYGYLRRGESALSPPADVRTAVKTARTKSSP